MPPTRAGFVPAYISNQYPDHGSKFCFIINTYFLDPAGITFVADPADPGQFVYLHGSYLFFHGTKPNRFPPMWRQIIHGSTPSREYMITFSPPLESVVRHNFENFHLEDGSGRAFREFHTLALYRADYLSQNPTPPTFPVGVRVQKIYRQNGVSYLLLKGAEVVSTAPVPTLLVENSFSFGAFQGIKTEPAHQQQGHARMVVRAAIHDLFCRHIPQVEHLFLWVEKDNFPALGLYQSLGFKIQDEWAGTQARIND